MQKSSIGVDIASDRASCKDEVYSNCCSDFFGSGGATQEEKITLVFVLGKDQ